MTQSYRALCADHYVNQKIAVKLDLPRNRETVLDLFERVRRTYPGMQQFRRYKEELALESASNALPNRWMAVRAHSIRSGVVNPDSREEASSLHRHILEV
ncbi:MAG: hypothetical protein KDA28_09505, partial [Phycisphaerales bacterium]|nr:hypothetical protein [Phycisphaerales bacterium]